MGDYDLLKQRIIELEGQVQKEKSSVKDLKKQVKLITEQKQ